MEDKDIEVVKFGRHLFDLRREQKISQEDLAFRSEINRTYIGEVERGEKNPSLTTIVKLAKGLNVDKKVLMEY